jgi:uncharacterized protein (TIRG00374 family)
LKKALINLLKYGCSAAIIAYLVWDARHNSSFSDLWNQPKRWDVLAAAWLLCMASVVVTIVRWYYLVRALELPFTMKDAFRLGFLGYLLNFVSLGSVGGDLFKAIFIAREHHRQRAQAVATVLIDRIIGMYALFVVATVAILVTGMNASPYREVQVICRATLIGMGVGTILVFVVLTPGFSQGRFSELLGRTPRLGPVFAKLLSAVRMYRSRLSILVLTTAMSIGVHLLSAAGIYLIGRGLGGQVPSLADHFVIVPMGMLVGVLPLPMSGLGAFEAVMEFFYTHVATVADITKGQGLVVAFGYRIITVTIAIVGVFYYLGSRREVAEVLHESEEVPELDPPLDGTVVCTPLPMGIEAAAQG